MLKITQILIKNTSTLDFTLPVLIKLSNAGHQVKIINLSKRNFALSDFYQNELRDSNIKFIDRTHYYPRLFALLILCLDLLQSIQKPIRKSENLSKKNSLSYKLKFLAVNWVDVFLAVIMWPISKIVSNNDGNWELLQKTIKSSDAILWDHRANNNFYFSNYVKEFLRQFRGKIFLIPHAPHFRDPESEIFKPITEILSNNITYLLPLNWSDNYAVYDTHDASFIKSGYPGLDLSWREYVSKKTIPSGCADGTLIIMRPFTEKGADNAHFVDHYVLSYNEMKQWLSGLVNKFDIESMQINVKLHPSNSHKSVRQLFGDLGLNGQLVIAEDDIFSAVANVKTVYGFYSTTLLVAAAFGCDTFCFKTQLVERSFAEWPILKSVYSDFGVTFVDENMELSPSPTNTNNRNLHYKGNATEFCSELITS